MANPHNRYRSAPPPPPVQGQPGSLMQTLGPLALKYGVNAAIPGGGFAADAATAVGSSFFNMGGGVNPAMDPTRKIGDALAATGGAMNFNSGGRAPLGGGQSAAALKEARSLGALTQAEFLKAMAHAGYKAGGGKIQMGPLAEVSYKSEGGEVWTRKHHDPNKAKPEAKPKKEG